MGPRNRSFTLSSGELGGNSGKTRKVPEAPGKSGSLPLTRQNYLQQRLQVIGFSMGHGDVIHVACRGSAGITGSLFSSASSSAAGLSSGVPDYVVLAHQTCVLNSMEDFWTLGLKFSHA